MKRKYHNPYNQELLEFAYSAFFCTFNATENPISANYEAASIPRQVFNFSLHN